MLRTAFLWSMIASLTLAAGLGILAILADGLGRDGERAIVTALLVGAFSMNCLACAFVLGRRRVRGVMWFGIGAAVAALVVWLTLVWFDFWTVNSIGQKALVKSGVAATTAAIWAAHFGMLSVPVIRRRSWRWVRLATFIFAGLLAVMVITITLFEEFEDWTARLIAVLSILAACGTVVTPILALIERLRDHGGPVALPSRVRVALTCPRCAQSMEAAPGKNHCPGCGLRIGLEIDEPRCACGYPLYRLAGTQCPECGKAIPAEARWSVGPVPPAGLSVD